MDKTAIIVEDQYVIALDLQIALKNRGFIKTNIFTSAGKAINFLENNTPSLGILDIRLSDDISGIEVAKILKERSVPFIFCSAFSNPNNLKLANELAPLAIVKKPLIDLNFDQAMDKYWDNCA
jgi:two-component system, NtrC family, response regulator HydG